VRLVWRFGLREQPKEDVVTVFQLFIYSCVTINAPISGELLQKTCQWGQRGGLYATHEACLRESPSLNSPIFSDVADGRKVEAIKCAAQSVSQ
jgi:hypothetical protein